MYIYICIATLMTALRGLLVDFSAIRRNSNKLIDTWGCLNFFSCVKFSCCWRVTLASSSSSITRPCTILKCGAAFTLCSFWKLVGGAFGGM